MSNYQFNTLCSGTIYKQRKHDDDVRMQEQKEDKITAACRNTLDMFNEHPLFGLFLFFVGAFVPVMIGLIVYNFIKE